MPTPKPIQPIAKANVPAAALTSTMPSRWQLVYDSIMLLIISVDLCIIAIDLVLMSQFAAQIAAWLGVGELTRYYQQHIHNPLRILGGGFTVFLIVELLLRWLLAVVQKKYLRWFFFPFIHWYEVLGCLPQLRALRLLRAVVIVHKLHRLGYRVLPQTWLASGKFYYNLIFEEITDRVILTATATLRKQMTAAQTGQSLIADTLDKNRAAIARTLVSLLQQELAPKLAQVAHNPHNRVTTELSLQVGAAVQDALANTPELRRYLRLIPIAGKLIESELHDIGQQVGANLVLALTARLSQVATTDALIQAVSTALADIDLANPELEALVMTIVDDCLTAFENEVKVQHWKHHAYLTQILD